MKKGFFFIILLCLSSGYVQAQRSNIDTVAVSILDRMSEMIGELHSCSATVKTNYDVSSQQLGLVKHADEEHIYVGGADKLLVTSEGIKEKSKCYTTVKPLPTILLIKTIMPR